MGSGEEPLARRPRLTAQNDSGFYGNGEDACMSVYISYGFTDDSTGNVSTKSRAIALSREVESLVSLPTLRKGCKANNLQAQHLQDNQCCIVTKTTKVRPFEVSCGCESVRQLESNSFLGSHIIDTVVGLEDPPEDGIVYLGTEIYAQIEMRGFGNSRSSVEGIERRGHWLFGIRDDEHYGAVRINWDEAEIGYYDPQSYHDPQANRARARKKEVTKVITQLNQNFSIEAHSCLSVLENGYNIYVMVTPAEYGTRHGSQVPGKIELMF
jgi:hypothetical protein